MVEGVVTEGIPRACQMSVPVQTQVLTYSSLTAVGKPTEAESRGEFGLYRQPFLRGKCGDEDRLLLVSHTLVLSTDRCILQAIGAGEQRAGYLMARYREVCDRVRVD